MAKNTKTEAKTDRPLLMTAHQMSKICGIGENTLRRLMDAGELEYLQVGSHRLLAEKAIWNYYERNKVRVAFRPSTMDVSA